MTFDAQPPATERSALLLGRGWVAAAAVLSFFGVGLVLAVAGLVVAVQHRNRGYLIAYALVVAAWLLLMPFLGPLIVSPGHA